MKNHITFNLNNLTINQNHPPRSEHIPNHILLSDEAKRRACETLTGMVERDWNHPSIGIWTIINEAWGVDMSNPDHRVWLAEMYDYMKVLDSTRLVSGNSACWGNFNVVSDLDEYHMYFAMPDHHDQWRDWVSAFAPCCC